MTEISRGPSKSLGVVTVDDMISLMPNKTQKDHVLHPTTLDAIFVAIYPAFSGEGMEHKTVMVPKFFKSISISHNISNTIAHRFEVRSNVERKNLQTMNASISVTDLGSTSPVIEIDDFQCTSVDISATEEKKVEATKLCFDMRWEHDISLMTSEIFQDLFKVERESSEAVLDSELQQTIFHVIKNTVEAMTTSDRENLTPHHKAMYN